MIDLSEKLNTLLKQQNKVETLHQNYVYHKNLLLKKKFEFVRSYIKNLAKPNSFKILTAKTEKISDFTESEFYLLPNQFNLNAETPIPFLFRTDENKEVFDLDLGIEGNPDYLLIIEFLRDSDYHFHIYSTDFFKKNYKTKQLLKEDFLNKIEANVTDQAYSTISF